MPRSRRSTSAGAASTARDLPDDAASPLPSMPARTCSSSCANADCVPRGAAGLVDQGVDRRRHAVVEQRGRRRVRRRRQRQLRRRCRAGRARAARATAAAAGAAVACRGASPAAWSRRGGEHPDGDRRRPRRRAPGSPHGSVAAPSARTVRGQLAAGPAGQARRPPRSSADAACARVSRCRGRSRRRSSSRSLPSASERAASVEHPERRPAGAAGHPPRSKASAGTGVAGQPARARGRGPPAAAPPRASRCASGLAGPVGRRHEQAAQLLGQGADQLGDELLAAARGPASRTRRPSTWFSTGERDVDGDAVRRRAGLERVRSRSVRSPCCQRVGVVVRVDRVAGSADAARRA